MTEQGSGSPDVNPLRELAQRAPEMLSSALQAEVGSAAGRVNIGMGVFMMIAAVAGIVSTACNGPVLMYRGFIQCLTLCLAFLLAYALLCVVMVYLFSLSQPSKHPPAAASHEAEVAPRTKSD